jgi:CheY-like chemotaxis protein
MPVLNGYEATQQIDSLIKTYYYIAQTAFVRLMKEQKLQVAMVSKPNKKENLFALIKSISANSRHFTYGKAKL